MQQHGEVAELIVPDGTPTTTIPNSDALPSTTSGTEDQVTTKRDKRRSSSFGALFHRHSNRGIQNDADDTGNGHISSGTIDISKDGPQEVVPNIHQNMGTTALENTNQSSAGKQ